MVSSTSLTISGSSAEVGSSNSMILGVMHSARAIATRCCWPPESWLGYLSACSGMRTRVEVLHRHLLGLRLGHAARAHRRQRAVLQDGEVREQVELLEHHADLGAHRIDVLAAGGELDAVDHDAALLHRLEPVDAADQRRLARARGPADHDALAPVRTDRSMSVSTWKLPYHLLTPRCG